MASRKFRVPTVGEDITCPALIASAGRIRIRSARAAQVARWFGLGQPADAKQALPPAPPLPAVAAGTITFISGPSGSGKSSLFGATRAQQRDRAGRRWIDLAAIDAPDVPLVDCFGDTPLREVLALLGRVGLGEAWSYLRTPAELSEGQRWRMRLALALHAASTSRAGADERPILACDEFAAVLDRVTAMVVAHRLRRAIDAMPHLSAVVATSHDDLEPALAPEVIVRCDFGKLSS
jgi:ABC-type ATPase with predicted acetyltransferase domain